ncbi:MAG TPA: response regulator transcription factor [Saprospiraceae bacterium]|nr:response regulator transcription factor [Saprospiraceae bacterium]HPI07093.1 response regulator transcription factor [Saprospiraceae bacterium]
MPIRTLIYEDNSDLRGALAALIGGTEGFELSGAFDNCVNVVEQVAALHPDVVLMDIDMPGMSGIEGVARLKKVHPQVEALMLTVFEDDDRVFEAVCAGAGGYLLKKTSPLRILDALREVTEGGAPMSPVIARKVLQLFPGKPAERDADLDKLTAREMEVLKTLSRGFSYKMVAAELNISIETVRTYVKRIYEKLQVHSVSEAISKVFLKNK